MSSLDRFKGKWFQQVSAAKITRGKLTDDKLLKIENHEQKQANLVQERYAISREVAEEQVKDFFKKQKP